MYQLSSINRSLFQAFIFILLLIFVRVIYSGSTAYIFLVWNLFLAWIPYILSAYFDFYRSKERWKQLALFLSWLLFFPNALYIVTDLIHLQMNADVPVWFDAVLLFASSFTGIIMAFVSMRRTEIYLSAIFSRKAVLLIIPFLLFLGSFGVYLGRFQRWNSWNVINDPLALGTDIITRFIFPFEHIEAWGIVGMLTILFSLIYSFLKIIPQAFATKDA